MFNDNDLWPRAQRGELRQDLLRESHPSPPRASLPLCTRSQIIADVDDQGAKIALVHQYRRPDGTLGAGGRPDPKQLFLNGVLYVVV